jgi:hypothetical protein
VEHYFLVVETICIEIITNNYSNTLQFSRDKMQRKIHMKISSANIFSEKDKKRTKGTGYVSCATHIVKVKHLNRMCYLALGRVWIIVSMLLMTVVVGLECVLKQKTKMTSYVIEM